ncbi:MAG: hypothetical protein K9J25_13225 [Bacteroidales bacterium]|nr:hypothetical protein [Bacteroidales bacterium]
MIRLAILLLIILPVSAVRAENPGDNCSNAYVRITGHSLLSDFELDYSLDKSTPGINSLESLLSGNTSKEISLPIDGFSAPSKRFKKDFRNLVKADSFPVINISFRAKEIQAGNTAVFRLGITIAGKTKYYNVKCNIQPLESNSYCIQGSRKMSIYDFGLKPPVLIPGLLKVNDIIDINFSITFETLT